MELQKFFFLENSYSNFFLNTSGSLKVIQKSMSCCSEVQTVEFLYMMFGICLLDRLCPSEKQQEKDFTRFPNPLVTQDVRDMIHIGTL